MSTQSPSNSSHSNTPNKFKSPVWKFFTIEENSKQACCNECGSNIMVHHQNKPKIRCDALRRHIRRHHPNIELLKREAKNKINCPFCSLKINNYNDAFSRHYTTKQCKYNEFYNSNGWSNSFNDAVGNINLSTERILKCLTETNGKSTVYVVRTGPGLFDWKYVGFTTVIERRLREHRRNDTFREYENVEIAVLISNISMEKAKFLEGLLIMASKLEKNQYGRGQRGNLLNKTAEFRNVISCIECSEDELVHEKVLLLHQEALQFLVTKWSTLDWIKFSPYNKTITIPSTISKCTSALSTLSPTTRRVTIKRAAGFYSP